MISVIFIAVVILTYAVAPSFIPDIATGVAAPFLKAGHFVSDELGIGMALLYSKETMARENARLTAELDQASANVLTLNEYKKDNDRLRELLGRPASDGKRVLAVIIAKPPSSAYDTLVLDAGSKNGIAVDDLVALGDLIIGKIVEVLPAKSKAVLFSSPGKTLAASLEIKTGAVQISLQGLGAGNFAALIPKDVEVESGDLVRLPELSHRLIGSVGLVESKVTDSFKTLIVQSPFNIATLDWVEIISGN